MDDFFIHPPQSTQHILHPQEKNPHLFRTPASPRFLNKNYLSSAVAPNRMGEFVLATWLMTLDLDEMTAFSIASGWDGDRVQVFQKDDHTYAVSWVILWDDSHSHHQFRSVLSSLFPIFLGITQPFLLDHPKGTYNFKSPQGKGNITWTEKEIHIQWGW